MRTSPARRLHAPMLLALTLLTAACSTPLQLQVAPPTTPPPLAELLQSESASSSDYSQRVLDWLQRARAVLEPSTPSSAGCRSTPESGSCL